MPARPEPMFLITCVGLLEMIALTAVPGSWDCILQAVGRHGKVWGLIHSKFSISSELVTEEMNGSSAMSTVEF